MKTPRKQEYRRLVKLKLTICVFVVLLLVGIDFVNQKINENQEHAYLIGKTLRALFTLELFEPWDNLGNSNDDKDSDDLDISLNSYAPHYHVHVDSLIKHSHSNKQP